MKYIKNYILSLLMVFTVGGVVLAAIAPQTVAAAGTSCEPRFLGFPAWYRGLVPAAPDDEGNCPIITPTDGNLSKFIWTIALNVIEMATMLVGYIALGLILYGGFQYLTSQGDPKGAEAARTTITNAVIGLVISIVAVAIINFIFAGIGGAV